MTIKILERTTCPKRYPLLIHSIESRKGTAMNANRSPESKTVLTPTEARQGSRRVMNLRVLVVSLVLLGILGLALTTAFVPEEEARVEKTATETAAPPPPVPQTAPEAASPAPQGAPVPAAPPAAAPTSPPAGDGTTPQSPSGSTANP